MYKLFHKREKVVTVRLGIYSLPEVAVPFKNACLYPRPESIFKRAQFQSLISMESWEINPFLDALILTTNMVKMTAAAAAAAKSLQSCLTLCDCSTSLVPPNINLSPHCHLPLDPHTFLVFFETRKA